MVIKYKPESLKGEVKELIELFEEKNISHDFEGYLEEEEYEEEDITINKDTTIEVWLPRSEYEEGPYTLKEVLYMVNEAKKFKTIDEEVFIGEKLALIRIDSYHREILTRLIDEDDNSIVSASQIINGQEYNVDIVEGLTSYAIALTLEGFYNKYTPPIDYDDMFIKIHSEKEIDNNIINDLVQAYIFEIKSTLGIEVHPSPRPYYSPDDAYDMWEEKGMNSAPSRLRPLLQGKGISELLKLYNSSVSTPNPEILILTNTKVIEYVSQTVIQKDFVNSTIMKLSSPRALSPDANYILELNKIFEEHRNNKKDQFAIKLTIQTCCDIGEISAIAPDFLKLTKKIKIDSKGEEKQRALEEVATAISHTRNMFAHAKTNYELKGKECPESQLQDFAKCIDVLAQQVIRWFAREHEDNRII